MTNATENLPANVTVDVYRNVRKDDKSYVAELSISGVILPLRISGLTTEEARTKAVDVYNNSLNTIQDFSVFEGEENEVNDRVIKAFIQPASVSHSNDEDKRHQFKNMRWMCAAPGEDGKPVRARVKPEDIEMMKKGGYKEGRDWELKGKTVDPNKTDKRSAFKEMKWVNRTVNDTVERKRIHESEVDDYLSEGWAKGRGKGAETVAQPETVTSVEANAEGTVEVTTEQSVAE